MKSLVMAVSAAAVLGLAGCAASPNAPTTGWIYTDTKSAVSATDGTAMPKTGQATCTSILGLVAQGDCSVQAAKINGGISHVTLVDAKQYSILGIYATYTTIVKGS